MRQKYLVRFILICAVAIAASSVIWIFLMQEAKGTGKIVCPPDLVITDPSCDLHFYCVLDGSLHETKDDGQHWEDISRVEDHVRYALLVTAPVPTIYIACHDKVVRSLDEGITWEEVFSIENAESEELVQLFISPDESTLWLLTQSGIFFSEPSGSEWAETNSSVPNPNATGMTFDPSDAKTVFVATTGAVYRSADLGETWDNVSTGLTDPWLVEIHSNSSGIFGVTHKGEVVKWDAASHKWRVLPIDVDCTIIGIATTSKPQILYAIEECGAVYRSDDEGKSWRRVFERPSELKFPGFYLFSDPNTPETIYKTGGSFHAISKSTDGGRSWRSIEGDLPRCGKAFRESHIATFAGRTWSLKIYSPQYAALLAFLLTVVILALAWKPLSSAWTKARGRIVNPFIAGGAIVSKDLFFGRDDIFENIQNALLDKDEPARTFFLVGGRRMGKSSILERIARGELSSRFKTVLISMEELAGFSTLTFLSQIFDKTSSSLKATDLSSPAETDLLGSFNKFLDEVEELLDDKALILLFDELEILADMIAKDELPARILDCLRSLEKRERIAAIYASVPQLLHDAQWAHMLAMAQVTPVSFLKISEAKQLVTQPVRRQAKYEAGSVEAILQTTAGHPYFTQYVCREIIDLLNEEGKRSVAVEDVKRAVQRIVRTPQPHLQWLWANWNERQKAILMALAEKASNDSFVPLSIIRETIEAHHVKFSEQDLQSALQQLLEDETLECQSGAYRFQVEIVRKWIAYYHPALQIFDTFNGNG